MPKLAEIKRKLWIVILISSENQFEEFVINLSYLWFCEWNQICGRNKPVRRFMEYGRNDYGRANWWGWKHSDKED